MTLPDVLLGSIMVGSLTAVLVSDVRFCYWRWEKRRQIRLRDAHAALINEQETG